MKKVTFLLCTFLGVFTLSSNAQSEEQMKAWMEYSSPGAMHKMLAKSNGEWNGDIMFWMSPEAPPTKATCVAKNEMIVGGRYQKNTNIGNMMGMPFEGIGHMGYDNATKKFTSTWIDNMGTGTMVLSGPYDEKSKSIILTGKNFDFMYGKEIEMKETITFIDDNNHQIEMFTLKDGKEFKTMQIKLTRKK
jgi:hypothetical protein